MVTTETNNIVEQSCGITIALKRSTIKFLFFKMPDLLHLACDLIFHTRFNVMAKISICRDFHSQFFFDIDYGKLYVIYKIINIGIASTDVHKLTIF